MENQTYKRIWIEFNCGHHSDDGVNGRTAKTKKSERVQRAIESEKHLARIFMQSEKRRAKKMNHDDKASNKCHHWSTARKSLKGYYNGYIANVIEMQWNRNWFASVTRIFVWKNRPISTTTTATTRTIHRWIQMRVCAHLSIHRSCNKKVHTSTCVFAFGSWIWHTISLHTSAQTTGRKKTFRYFASLTLSAMSVVAIYI